MKADIDSFVGEVRSRCGGGRYTATVALDGRTARKIIEEDAGRYSGGVSFVIDLLRTLDTLDVMFFVFSAIKSRNIKGRVRETWEVIMGFFLFPVNRLGLYRFLCSEFR